MSFSSPQQSSHCPHCIESPAKFAPITTFAVAQAASVSVRTSVCTVDEVTPQPVAPSPPPNAPDNLQWATKCTTVLSTRPSGQSTLPTPSPSPIREGRCHTLLAKHPDKTFVKYVLSGLDHGFTNGYPAQHHNLTCQNLLSAEQHHVFITAHLHTCCTNGETAGPISSPPIEPFHSSGVRAIPKKSGKLHLLHHLSDP